MTSGRVRRWLAGWRVPLRIARRDARRARGRTALTLLLLALPVLAVTVADTVYATDQLSGTEGIERRLGQAEVRVELVGSGRAYQAPDPDQASQYAGGRRDGAETDLEQVAATLGDPSLAARAVPVREGSVRFTSDLGEDDAQSLVTDLDDPLTAGMVELTSGRLPRTAQEVVVNAALVEQGPEVGDALVVGDDELTIVGTAESAAITGEPFVAAPPGSPVAAGGYGGPRFLLDSGPVSWAQVRELNDQGVLALSRAVLADPPADDELDPQVAYVAGQLDQATITAGVLIAVMVLIEVVLLAGPAFAVGARRQSRTLALVAAAGGTPRDARRVVLASGVVLGLAGAVLGVVLGVAGAWALQPAVQRLFVSRLGPFDVVGTHLAAVAAFGLLSALLAAAVPALLAARQDVVAVLAGRRGDATPSRRSPLVGLVLLGVGVALAVWGARDTSGSSWSGNAIAGAAIVCVLGMLLLVPVVVTALARAARPLPLALRFAARDAARHRTRTVPAVAAVAATVAGVVALGIAVASDEEQNAAGYTPLLAEGDGVVGLTGLGGRMPDAGTVRAAIASQLPDAEVADVRGVLGRGFVELRAGRGRQDGPLLTTYQGALGSVLVSGRGLPDTVTGVAPLTREQEQAVDRVLAAGGVVALSDTGADVDEVRLVVFGRDRRGVEVPAVTLPVEAGTANVAGVVSPGAAEAAGVEVGTAALLVTGDLPRDGVDRAEQAVAGVPGDASLYVERGYQPAEEVRIVQLVLGALGGVLMLGGTLTATFLALNDARPDLATLGAVGAAPRVRRLVAAAYALVVAVVGAALGALVGLVPGIAVSFSLTRPYDLGFGEMSGPSHYLDVPWVLLLVVVVGLPVLSAAVVAVASRSRLPLAARLE